MQAKTTTCSIDGCSGLIFGRGWCHKHWMRWRRHGDPLHVERTYHGHRYTPLYKTWQGMVERCTNPKSQNYADYGGRGITICDRWRKFENLLADMGERPEGMTLDRKDNDGNYEPGNCRWATRSEQQKNKRRKLRM